MTKIEIPHKFTTSVVFAGYGGDHSRAIPPLDRHHLYFNLLEWPIGRKHLDAREFVIAVMAQFLYGSPLLTPTMWRTLMDYMLPALRQAALDAVARLEVWSENGNPNAYPLEPTIDSESDLFMVTISDGQWISWTDSSYFMDKLTGLLVEHLPAPAVEMVSYQLMEVVHREWRRCSRHTVISPAS